MAVCLMVDNPRESREQFETVMQHLSETGPVPPVGASLLVAGPTDAGWRVISIWDSQDALQSFFTQRLAPAYGKAGLSLEGITRSVFEVHTQAVAQAGEGQRT